MVGGLVATAGGMLLLSTCGTRALTGSAPSAAWVQTLCAGPGLSRTTCTRSELPADRLSASEVDDVTATTPAPTTAATTVATSAPTTAATTTVAPTTVMPTTVPETAAPAPVEAAPPEPEPEPDPEPEETAPPTTRKARKPAPAATAAPEPTAPPAAPPVAPPEETAPPAPPPAPVKVDTSVSGRVVALVNAQRSAAGLAPVSANGALTAAAAGHSKDQAATHTMSHTGSNGSTMAQRCSAAGYGWRGLGENVAAGYGSADSVMTGWMNSAGHRANILNGAYLHIGVAVAYAADGTPYWTMDLGTPA